MPCSCHCSFQISAFKKIHWAVNNTGCCIHVCSSLFAEKSMLMVFNSVCLYTDKIFGGLVKFLFIISFSFFNTTVKWVMFPFFEWRQNYKNKQTSKLYLWYTVHLWKTESTNTKKETKHCKDQILKLNIFLLLLEFLFPTLLCRAAGTSKKSSLKRYIF